MDQITNTVIDIYKWAERDYHTWPLRFYIEVVAWAISIGCSLTMACTVPHPPLLSIYPVWIAGCAMYGWCAWTRGSTGMVANYILLVMIDIIGLVRLISN